MFELNKSALQKNLLYIASFIFLSRALGFWQDKLFANYFCGVNAISDAFFIAFRIPNFLRRMLGDGLISVALTPIVVLLLEQKLQDRVAKLLTFFMMTIVVLLGIVSAITWYNASHWINFFAPGLSTEQFSYAQLFFPRMFFFTIFIGACEILSVWLRAINHFITPALGPSIFHISMITSLFLTQYFSWPATALAWAVSIAAIIKLVIRLSVYQNFGLFFAWPTQETLQDVKLVFKKMIPLLCGCGILQTHILVEGIVGSYLPTGDVSILHYAYRLFHFPFMVLTIPISSVFLPHFTREGFKSKLRLNFWFYEVIKGLAWLMIPIIFTTITLSYPLFSFFYGQSASPELIFRSSNLLRMLCIGLPVNAINLICFTLFYSMKDTYTPTAINAISTTINIAGCFIGLKYFGLFGIAASTTISHLLVAPSLFFLLHSKHKIVLPKNHFFAYLGRLCLQSISLVILTHIVIFPMFTFLHNFIPWIWYSFIILPHTFCWLTKKMFKTETYLLTISKN